MTKFGKVISDHTCIGHETSSLMISRHQCQVLTVFIGVFSFLLHSLSPAFLGENSHFLNKRSLLLTPRLNFALRSGYIQ
jgi:hypothetical protein